MTFVKEKSVGKFSIYVTAFLLFATVFKTMFYFITPYGTALFIQNFLIIAINVPLTPPSSWSSISSYNSEATRPRIPLPCSTASGSGLHSSSTVTFPRFSYVPGLFYPCSWIHHLPEHCQRVGGSVSRDGLSGDGHRDLYRFAPDNCDRSGQEREGSEQGDDNSLAAF